MDSREHLIEKLVVQNNQKILLLVLDGIGDIPHRDYGKRTPLEYAITPNLDKLAKDSVMGRMIPVLPGVTPGSGPGHLGLFGYDPLQYQMGRGILEAAGLNMDIKDGDIAVRCNFASADENGVITDRRAGRISTEKCEELCSLISENIKEIDGVQIILRPSMQHRFVVVFRGQNLCDRLTDSDPLAEGKQPIEIKALDEKAAFTAQVANKFYQEVRKVIKDLKPANSLLMRGFSVRPRIPTMMDRFKLNSVCLASYPMYKGLSKLVGMTVIDEAGKNIEELFQKYCELHNKYDFFFIHVKYTDSNGEDGNFVQKAKIIEEVDKALPILLEKKPNVLCITGDHSTPAAMKAHSWHHVPVMINSSYCGADGAMRFTENECNNGGMGNMESKYLINYLLANAMKLNKYGA
ncbi:MAG TPA: 2,3-bisphosphoglycerate-independent phosphoglycerate mutase [Patescibacteria group bacterium]|nr:2,3-bisphosphoglycerate-independent phosphoglycerate mutase [Patescibacteria group bacterium]